VNQSPDSSPILPVFDRRHQLLLGALAAFFILTLLLRLNGWSLPIWHDIIDGSKPNEILVGKVRDVRVDDFLLDLPMTLAQAKHHPYFPVINHNIGSGEFMPAPINVPAGVFITFFRPFTWGFLIGTDVGLAWKWWGLTLGLFYFLFLVFLLASRNRFGLSAWASLALVASPYFQFWSLHKAEIAIHWAGAFVAIACLLAARRRWVIWAAGLSLGWSISAMALDHIYPPIAVTVGWLLPFAVAAWSWDRRLLLPLKESFPHRLGAALLALAVIGGSLAVFWAQSSHFLELIRDTNYPGRRFSVGGDTPLWPFFGDDFFAQAHDASRSWIGNICEDASFLFVFPAIWILLLAAAVRRRGVFEVWNGLLALYVGVVMIFSYVGFPAWLAHLTLFGMSTSNRTQMGLGLANQLMLVAACSNGKLRAALTPGVRWFAVIGWLGVLAVWGCWFRQRWPEMALASIGLGLGFQAILSYLFWIRDRPTLAMALLGLASVGYTAWFNPWVRGGSDFIFHNPLSNEIRALDRADGRTHRWVVFGDFRLSNLPPILGVQSIGGYNTCPDFATWTLFDPTGAYRPVYNQCAYAAFTIGGDDQASFLPWQPGLFKIAANPLSPAFAQAGVRYFLVAGADQIQAFVNSGGFREVFSYAGRSIFERK
jgi:hypothetical protein